MFDFKENFCDDEMPITPKQNIGDSVCFYSEDERKVLKGIVEGVASGYNNGFYLFNIIKEEFMNKLHLVKNENIISKNCQLLIWEILIEEEMFEQSIETENLKGFAILC